MENMASFSDLRPSGRPARSGSHGMPPVKWLVVVLAVFAALLSTAFFAVPELATLRGAKADNATAFLTRELGQPQAGASLVGAPTRTWPALGGKLQIAGGGLRASAGRST